VGKRPNLNIILSTLLGVFVLDLLAPLGYAVWIIYLFPLILASPLLKRRHLLLFSAATTTLLLMGFFFSPPAIDRPAAVFNRLLGIASLWTATLLIMRRRKVDVSLQHARENLEKQVVERTRELKESEERYRELVQNANSIIIKMDVQGKILFFNEFAQNFFGYAKDEIIGRNAIGTIIPYRDNTGRDLAAMFEEIKRDPDRFKQNENENIKKNGVRAWIAWTNKAVYDSNGNVIGFLSVGQDITERRRAEETLLRERNRAQRYLDIAGVIIIALDREQKVVMINQKGCDILGYSEEEIRGKNWFDHFIPAEDTSRVKDTFNKLMSGRIAPVEHFENPVLTRSGELRIMAWHNTIIRDGSGAIIELLSSGEDITERKKAEETLEYQMYHDLLTGLPNRTFFMEHLSLALPQAHRRRQKLAVMFLDIDRFKVTNDTFGHTAGDELLKKIAIRLKGCMRESDILARIGGDEFTILLPDITHVEDAARISEKISTVLKQPFRVNDQEIYVTASIGISIYPDDSNYGEDLLKHADIAMFHAKEQGGNGYQFYSPSINIRTLERIILESSLRRTLERGELVVHYQPQVNVNTREIVGVEALVRWQHPELGLLHPDQFLPLAEEIGFTLIDEWVLRTACAQAREWHETGLLPIRVTVNLTARQFKHPNLVALVSQVLQDAGLDPEWLELEITENVAMADVTVTAASLIQLTRMGVKCSIDDFGTGYSSLSYLKRLPIHKLKIDKSFIHGLIDDPEDQAIVNAVISLAHSLNLKVVAEGVEKEEQVLFLQEKGCDEMQGYVFSRPLPAAELSELMAMAHS
jgi:diguanylate cyclase (GGDEF)-like protein/PAS domain S-box-containing protein